MSRRQIKSLKTSVNNVLLFLIMLGCAHIAVNGVIFALEGIVLGGIKDVVPPLCMTGIFSYGAAMAIRKILNNIGKNE